MREKRTGEGKDKRGKGARNIGGQITLTAIVILFFYYLLDFYQDSAIISSGLTNSLHTEYRIGISHRINKLNNQYKLKLCFKMDLL